MFFAKIKSAARSIRARLTILYLGLLTITLVVFCAILFQVFVTNHEKEFDITLYNHAVDISQSISVDLFGDYVFKTNAMLANEKIFPFALGRSYMQVVSPEGTIVARSNNLSYFYLPLHADDWQRVFQSGSVFRTLPPSALKDIPGVQKGTTYRQISLLVRRGKPAFILQVAVPMSLLSQETTSLLLFFIFGIPVTLLLAGLAGIYLANKALEPVRDIIVKAEQLNPANLSERLPEPGTGDEIQMLTVTLNGFLGRIERAFQSLENFIADASHQLKTPVAILRGELDVFRSKTRSPEETNNFLQSSSQELMHMSRLIDDLLLLAKIDAGAGSLTLQKIRLDEILLEAVAKIEVLAQKKNISIRLDLDDKTEGESEDDFLVDGDSDLLRSMFRNLLDNAIKYSENAPVEVRVINEDKNVITQIRDYGEPIPNEVLERLFRRYERGNLRMNSASGTGLGLTIAQRIAELHGGKISILQNFSTGKAFQVEMKKF